MFFSRSILSWVLMSSALISGTVAASSAESTLPLTSHYLGLISVFIFVIAYFFVVTEEITTLRKSKPVVLAAGIIWTLLGLAALQTGHIPEIKQAVYHNFTEYGQLLLFLVVAMTYLNALAERGLFQALRSCLTNYRLSYRSLFWLTGVLAFIISPFADNLTTALLLGAVVLALAGEQKQFVSIACINIVVAANAGGAFSPFGDITTLMVWQVGVVKFSEFFYLFLPAVVNFIVPAFCMHWAVPKGKPVVVRQEVRISYGGNIMLLLFIFTIMTAVLMQHYLELPPALGMMTGLGYLGILSFFIKKQEQKNIKEAVENTRISRPYDLFQFLEKIEWDTLLFFYGVMMCVGGLATFGYLAIVANGLYHGLGQTLPTGYMALPANVIIGLVSALVDNIPVMYAVLNMNLSMPLGQWLLVTLTAGVGGSLLSVGSAAGVALMGQSRGMYTFTSHLKWTWAVLFGYIAAVGAHVVINKALFQQ